MSNQEQISILKTLPLDTLEKLSSYNSKKLQDLIHEAFLEKQLDENFGKIKTIKEN